MQDLITVHSVTLSTFDLKHYQLKIDRARQKLTDEKKKAAPKKFSFKKKTTAPSKIIKQDENQNSNSIHSQKQEIKKEESKIQIPNCNQICNINDSVIIISNTEFKINGEIQNDTKELDSEFNVLNIKNSEIYLHGVMKTLRLSSLENCKVFSGPVSRSIMVNNCINSIIHIASQQIRIHDCKDSSFYVLCKSKPIIEDCSSVKFGEYKYSYDSLNEHLEVI